ncbi:hypothetical protein EG68_09025 [Paragonimus skrjabini miyazakii]|uniref:Uncharacterized protein n=1 Tax=Paragonimus skrjabini miyazakii TaxID=59628 RepID=A0A8S9YP62_9TREM|nr:hypothetical protein EG68_09025 [Paragonimus skrjabini miyazakii]
MFRNLVICGYLTVLLFCLTNVEAGLFGIRMKYDSNDIPYVEFDGRRYVCDREELVKYTNDAGCEVGIYLRRPTAEEQSMREGSVSGSVLCPPRR